MLAVNYTNLRDNMKRYMDQVTDDYETMIVTRKNNKNVVILSEETYNNLMENVYVMGNKANYDWLMAVSYTHLNEIEAKDKNKKPKNRAVHLNLCFRSRIKIIFCIGCFGL